MATVLHPVVTAWISDSAHRDLRAVADVEPAHLQRPVFPR